MRIGVLGGGQLGRMLALAGYPLGHVFTFLDPAPDACAGQVGDLIVAAYDDAEGLGELAARSDVVTYEFENVPESAAEQVVGEVPLWPPPQALGAAQDRLAEKRLFASVGLAVAPYEAVSEAADLERAVARVGVPCLLKTRRQGYDGKGQVRIDDPGDAADAFRSLGEVPCLLETVVPFERELSLLAVRSTTGESAFYPLIENHHRRGILRLSLAPAPAVPDALQRHAESVATHLLDSLGYVGVVAIEMFEADGELLGNEMAPRVHNSGHYSIEGAVTSQFENHVRAVTGAPPGPTAPTGPAIMVNLIGEVPDVDALLAIPGLHLHLYGKGARPGRKLGHVTLCGDPATLGRGVDTLRRLVPDLPPVDVRA